MIASVYINIKMLQPTNQPQYKAGKNASEESTFHPVPSLFRLLGLVPFKKAQFTPDDLYSRKRPADTLGIGEGPVTGLLCLEKCRKTSFGKTKDEAGEEEAEESISDSDVDKIIGTSENSELQERDAPETLQCELRPYQKQALHWMHQLENYKGASLSSSEDAATSLHPCWDAYRLADERGLVVYLNSFSGDATVEFPSMLQIARGGILADAMGLGKTIMTISLIVSESGKGCCLSTTSLSSSKAFEESLSLSSPSSKKPTSPSIFTKLLRKPKAVAYVGGGNLIVCPMTLLGQWKAEIETHVKPGTVTLYTHYGQSRAKDASFLAQSDIVLTTYGVLASEFSAEDAAENGGLYSVHWFRVVLDEAHVIKSTKSQMSLAASALSADRRWCLSGTPIQNKLDDIYSLLRFLRIEPWRNWGLWNKLIQKPYDEGDERGLQLVQSILKPIMLRRTKSSTDKAGRPILDLPPANTEVVYCELSKAEKDFYEALFHRSKVKFDQFVEQGKVLHNYASILELLLRLRQCCDHPFLVMSRGDTQEYSDLNKLTKRLLKAEEGVSKAYIKEAVEELEKGEGGECPICLEALEDAVLTPCAHRMCRECLFSSWRSGSSSISAGLCPICRNTISKQDLITAPTSSRFRIDVESNWVESSKVSFLLRELELLRDSKSQSTDGGAKSIVFSQWTAFLDLLEIPLSRRHIAYLRLDGTLNQQQRERVIKEFREDRTILVLLMSLKAGGVGINLTAASNAFLMDPWWNPAVEEQALMRIHRIGQTKPVSIKRFIVKGTVEESMEAIQARKQRMICGALTDQEVRTARIQELKMLFS
ncbi:DNA/RNA helicase protein isoform X3 [Carex rostrata]